jgi:hypothetical protein
VAERKREAIDGYGLVEKVPETQVGDGGRKVEDGLVEKSAETDVEGGEGGREVVDWPVEVLTS